MFCDLGSLTYNYIIITIIIAQWAAVQLNPNLPSQKGEGLNKPYPSLRN